MKIHIVYFSPTKTGASVVQAIRQAVRAEYGNDIDITTSPSPPVVIDKEDLLIVGMPVYGGRLPALSVERFKSITGKNARAVPVVIYGNRAYDDALLELSDLCKEQGFRVVSGAAFIGEHSFSTDQRPIASGRPDLKDMEKTEGFGAFIQSRLSQCVDDEVSVPGNRPYKVRMELPGGAADTDPEQCSGCGLCEKFCPSGAISVTQDGLKTDSDACIWCAACVKVCVRHARKIVSPKILEVTDRLYKNCQARLEPVWF